MQSFFQYRRLRASIQREISEEIAYSGPTQTYAPPMRRALSDSTKTSSSSDFLRPQVKRAQTYVTRSISSSHELVVPPLTKSLGSITVEFCQRDSNNPRHWSLQYKIFCSFLVFLLVFTTGWASAADSVALERARTAFHVSKTAESLITSMYLFGVATGALLAGPITDTAGRNPVYFISFVVYMFAVLCTGLARNYATQITFRFFAGFFASPSMSIFGGSLADLFDTEVRGVIWPVFALAPILGPTLAPIPNGWIVQSNLSWHWVEWLTLILSAVVFILTFTFLPETRAPIILEWKAGLLRQLTGNQAYISAQEKRFSFFSRLRTRCHRIFIFTTQEPITILIGLYMTMVYILIFTFLHGFTFIFSETYALKVGLTGTAFAAVAVGVILASTLITPGSIICRNYLTQKPPIGRPPTPETRLYGAMIAAPLLPIALFWLGWTDNPAIDAWSGRAACTLLGFALMGIFESTYHYIIDSYETHVVTAMAAITFMRYFGSAAIVIADQPMYQTLGVRWTMTLMAIIAVVMVPVPWVFCWKGECIRRRSKFMAPLFLTFAEVVDGIPDD